MCVCVCRIQIIFVYADYNFFLSFFLVAGGKINGETHTHPTKLVFKLSFIMRIVMAMMMMMTECELLKLVVIFKRYTRAVA